MKNEPITNKRIPYYCSIGISALEAIKMVYERDKRISPYYLAEKVRLLNSSFDALFALIREDM